MLIAKGGNAAAIRGLVPGFGFEIIASEAALGNVVMVDAAGVFYADGGVEIHLSEYASLQMNDAPDSPPTAATVPTTLWQSNLVGYKVERYINFQAVSERREISGRRLTMTPQECLSAWRELIDLVRLIDAVRACMAQPKAAREWRAGLVALEARRGLAGPRPQSRTTGHARCRLRAPDGGAPDRGAATGTAAARRDALKWSRGPGRVKGGCFSQSPGGCRPGPRRVENPGKV